VRARRQGAQRYGWGSGRASCTCRCARQSAASGRRAELSGLAPLRSGAWRLRRRPSWAKARLLGQWLWAGVATGPGGLGWYARLWYPMRRSVGRGGGGLQALNTLSLPYRIIPTCEHLEITVYRSGYRPLPISCPDRIYRSANLIVEADLELFCANCNCWSAGFLGERL